MKNRLLLSAVLVLLFVGGFGCQETETSTARLYTAKSRNGAVKGLLAIDDPLGKANINAQEPAKEAGNEGGKPDPKGAGNPASSRKIRYAGIIELITEDFPKAEAAVAQLVKDAQGYLANSEITGSPGSIRAGFWKVRIPVKEFDTFRAAVVRLGEVQKNATDSQDLTEEYYDLENNIKNRQTEEEALRKLMDKAADKMENFLAVRRELNQVREDIDRKLGRLKLLANLTDMTTVSLTIRERQKYVPDQAPESAEIPTFSRRLGKTFSDSAGSVVSFFQAVALVLAALAPWSPLLLAAALFAWIYLRRHRRSQAPPAHE